MVAIIYLSRIQIKTSDCPIIKSYPVLYISKDQKINIDLFLKALHAITVSVMRSFILSILTECFHKDYHLKNFYEYY